MIEFSCSNCEKKFAVDDKHAGRAGKCKNCGATVTVPVPKLTSSDKLIVELPPLPTKPPVVDKVTVKLPPLPQRQASTQAIAEPKQPSKLPTQPKLSPRNRRLIADANQVQSMLNSFAPINVLETLGTPPEIYRIQYNVKGLVRGSNGQPVPQTKHVVEIQLTKDYPRQSPKCKMLTPIFHPNIEPATICVGDHWTAGERLVDLIVRIGEMIAFQAYNIKSPLDGEAAMWTDLNRKQLPIDSRSLQPPEM